jgi:hypothetical protein
MSGLGRSAAGADLGLFSVLRKLGLFRRSGPTGRTASLADIRPRESSRLAISQPSTHEETLMRTAYGRVAEILREAKGRPLTVDEVREAVRHTNPTKSMNPGAINGNCSECTMAVDDILAGRPAVAGKVDQLPQEDDIFSIFGNRAPGENIPLRMPGTYGDVESELLARGPGARGIFMGRTTPLLGGTPHVGNVANIGGEVFYIDGQGQIVEKFTAAADKSNMAHSFAPDE